MEDDRSQRKRTCYPDRRPREAQPTATEVTYGPSGPFPNRLTWVRPACAGVFFLTEVSEVKPAVHRAPILPNLGE
jgi:hypothetical protein